MEVTITMTDEQATLLVENAIRNFPADIVKEPKEIMEFIVQSTTHNDKRAKFQAKFDKLSNDELKVLLP